MTFLDTLCSTVMEILSRQRLFWMTKQKKVNQMPFLLQLLTYGIRSIMDKDIMKDNLNKSNEFLMKAALVPVAI